MLRVELEIVSLNFFWSEKGYTWDDGTPIESLWEDVYYSIYKGDYIFREGGTTFESKKFYRLEADNLHGNLGVKLETKFPGYVEEELNYARYENIPMKDMQHCNEHKWSFTYDDRKSPDFFEIKDMVNLPCNEENILPCYISGFIPDDTLNRTNIEEAMKRYISRFFNHNEDLEFVWRGIPSNEYLKKEYESLKYGKPPKVMLLPQPLSMLIGQEAVEILVDRGFKYAEKVSGTDDYLYHFEDGHTEISNSSMDLLEHLSKPEQDI